MSSELLRIYTVLCKVVFKFLSILRVNKLAWNSMRRSGLVGAVLKRTKAEMSPILELVVRWM